MMLSADFLNFVPIFLFISLPLAAYLWLKHRSTFWKRHNVPHIPALPLLGNFKNLVKQTISPPAQFQEFYNDPTVKDAAFCGIHIFHKPGILVRDPELVKQILVKDFNSFSDRYGNSGAHDKVGGMNLFFLRNPLWKKMRGRLSPFFSSGKMKQMFHLISDIGTELNKTMRTMSTESGRKPVCTEAKDFTARYSTDVIANCAFGVQANSLRNPNSDFRKNGKTIFDFNWYRSLEFSAIFFMPEIANLFKFRVFADKPSKFLRNTINYVMNEREKSGARRNDLIDTLVELKTEDKNKVFSNTDVVFHGDILVAQAAVFFSAGYETSSSTMAFGLFELAKKPEIQKRLRQEIKDTLEKVKGDLTYESVQDMTYIHMVISEILRMHPILGFLDRRCTLQQGENGYSMEPFSDFAVPQNMPVIIPISAIQRDPKYFPNPDKFDPERFSVHNKQNIVPYTYLPFGTGPHNCVGERFGLLQTKVGLINILRNHQVTLSDKTPVDMVYEKKSLFLQSAGGIYVNFEADPLML